MLWLLGGSGVLLLIVCFFIGWMDCGDWNHESYEKWLVDHAISKQEAQMPETKTKLSQAITKGISMRPKRAQGVYFAGEDRSDVLGAAYQGLTGEDDVHNYQVEQKLEEAFPILRRKVSNPETGEVSSLKRVLRQLNDKHQWKRKSIVRFVKSVEDRRSLHSVPSR